MRLLTEAWIAADPLPPADHDRRRREARERGEELPWEDYYEAQRR